MITLQFNDMTAAVDDMTDQSANILAARICAQAKTLAPVDKGALRNSIMWRSAIQEGGFNSAGGEKASEKITPRPAKYTAYVGTNLFYAAYQEYGTRKSAPNPFLRPSILIYSGQNGISEVKSMINKERIQGKIVPGEKRVFD